MASLSSPPTTDEPRPEATFLYPPPTVPNRPEARFSWPPDTFAQNPTESLKRLRLSRSVIFSGGCHAAGAFTITTLRPVESPIRTLFVMSPFVERRQQWIARPAL